MRTWVYCGGLWSPWVRFEDDLGIRRARGILEVLEARTGKETVLFHWEDHLKRLEKAYKRHPSINSDALPSGEEIKKKAKKLLSAGPADALVLITVTAGSSRDHKKPIGKPKLILDITPFPVISESPLKLKTINARREFPEIKLTAGYGYADFYQAEAESAGYDSFLYWSPWDGIAEGPFENVFFITKDEILVTPQNGILRGITRQVVLELAREPGLFKSVEERNQIHLGMLSGFYEAFVTSTTKWVHPVALIDGYSHLKTGPDTKTALLRERFLAYRENYYKERGA